MDCLRSWTSGTAARAPFWVPRCRYMVKGLQEWKQMLGSSSPADIHQDKLGWNPWGSRGIAWFQKMSGFAINNHNSEILRAFQRSEEQHCHWWNHYSFSSLTPKTHQSFSFGLHVIAPWACKYICAHWVSSWLSAFNIWAFALCYVQWPQSSSCLYWIKCYKCPSSGHSSDPNDFANSF